MGGGYFTAEAYESIRISKSYGSKSRDQIFTARGLDPEMDPRKVVVRESRDSAEHPESLAVIVALDVTGSMGFVPEQIVKQALPDLVGTMIQEGIPDPQVLFLGIGDFVYDDAPLQVGQFESSAELLDRWLTKVYLEGGGGGNNCESYSLAHLVAARHTSVDCWEKRKQKGFLFTIGDEPCNPDIPADIISRWTTEKNKATVTTADIVVEARERWHVYHLHVEHNAAAATDERKAGWKDILGQHFMILKDHATLAKKIASIVVDQVKADRKSGTASGPGKKTIPGPDVEDML